MKSWKALAALVLTGGMVLGATMVAAPAFAQPKDAMSKAGKKDDSMKKAAAVGDVAPAFTLTDTDGKTVNLADFAGKIVVLEWFNPSCPFIVKHHDTSKGNMTFNKLFDEFNPKGVVFLAINSGAKGKEGAGKEVNAKMRSTYKMGYPVLLDEDGKVGHAYGATNTPQCFVIGKDGKIAYKGAIDNNEKLEGSADKNYVKMALDEVLAGKAVSTAETKPYGCSVKYASK